MSYKKSLTILLPGHGWEDFPLDEPAEPTKAYGTAAVVAYHPSVIHALRLGPDWESVQAPPQLEVDYTDGLFLVGSEFRKDIDEDWIVMVEAAGAEILDIDADCSAEELLDAVLERVDPAAIRTFSSQWTADLSAVGFALFQIELITRRIQYINSIDSDNAHDRIRSVVRSLAEDDEQTAKKWLEDVYDRLTEAREYQYPVESYQFDMTLVAPTTLGESLSKELTKQINPINLLMTGELVEKLAERHPTTLALIAERCRRDDASNKAKKDKEDERPPGTIYYHPTPGLSEEEQSMVTILGGPWVEMPCPLMNHESILANLQRGFEVYWKYYGQTPTIYARRRAGFTPMLPQILLGLGMNGAVHVGLEGKPLPHHKQSRILWEGHGDRAIAALSGRPVDVADPGGFLKLPEQLGEVFAMDHSPTLTFVHWPNRSCDWHGYLRQIARRSMVLGQAMAADRYFSKTSHQGQEIFYAADRYRSGFLASVRHHDSRDPISRWARYHNRLLRFQTIKTVAILAELAAVPTSSLRLGRETLDRINDLVLHPDEVQEVVLDAELSEWLGAAIALLVSGIASTDRRGSMDSDRGILQINPTSTARGVVPGFGFAWAGAADANEMKTSRKTKRSFLQRFKKPSEEPPLAEEHVLRNEFFEVTLDPATGAIRAVHDYRVRGNRLAQQIALRMADSQGVVAEARGASEFWNEDCEERLYTIMAADSQEVLSAGPRVGRIVTRGRLVDRHGIDVAGFSQTTQVERGSRVLGLEIELDPYRHPSGNPWNAYYAARFAWGDSSAALYRSVGPASEPCEVDRIESPYFLDVRTEKTRTTILPHGLPFHRRFGLRKLDTILSVQGETARRFRLGIAFDSPIPTQAALSDMMPILTIDDLPRPDVATGWLVHLDHPNVVATDFEPIRDAETGKFIGMTVRLLEVEGARTRLRLQVCRSIGTAEVTDFLGKRLETLPAQGQSVEVTLEAREWKQLRLRWA